MAAYSISHLRTGCKLGIFAAIWCSNFCLHRTNSIFQSLYRSFGPTITLSFPNSAVLRHSAHVGALAAQSLEARLDHGAQGAFLVTHVDQLIHTACLQKGSQTASGVIIGPFTSHGIATMALDGYKRATKTVNRS